MKYLYKSLNIYTEIWGEEHSNVGVTYTNIAVIYMYKSDYDEAYINTNKALKIYDKVYGQNHNNISFCYEILGFLNKEKGNCSNTIKYFRKVLDIRKKLLGEIHSDVGIAYENVGLGYSCEGDQDVAIEYVLKALNIFLKTFGEKSQRTAGAYSTLGAFHEKKGNFDKAIENYSKSLKIRFAIYNGEHYEIASSLSNLSLAYLKKKKYKLSLKHEMKALEIFKRLKGERDASVARSYVRLGKILYELEDYNTALYYFDESLLIRLELFENIDPIMAESYLEIGKVHKETGSYKESELFLIKALNLLSPNDNFSLDHWNNIPQTLVVQNCISTLYYNRYRANLDSHYLFKAKINFIKYDEIVQCQRKKINHNLKANLVNVAYSTYENAIHTDFLLHKETSDPKHINDAFSYAEKTKSLSLFESIQNADALKHSGIPDSLLEKEYDLGIDIAYYNKKRFEEINSGLIETDTAVLEISSKLFDLKQEQEALRKQFETDYKKYHQLKYDLKVASVTDVQAHLPDDKTALIEYFLGDSTLTAFAITKTGIHYDQQSIDSSFHQKLEMMRGTLLPRQQQLDEDSELAYTSFLKTSYDLYQTLLDPVLQQVDGIENLIIIPDGQLGYLPFETLLTKKVNKETENYRSLPYLLRDYDIRYDYSATLLLQATGKVSKSPKLFAGFAPDYGKGDFLANRDYFDSLKIVRSYPGLRNGGLSPLKFNQPEVTEIASTIDGFSMTGTMATESAFKQEAGDYKILHLAMHALVNDLNPMYSHLVFAEETDTIEDRYLHAYELYNMQLDADLAVLSACETGIGKLQRGEGIMSLSRAFKYAGCPSIVTSMWKANDQSTKEIMTAFYKNLKDGMSKSKALKKAKLDFLDHTELPGMTHPTNWATFVLIGNNDAVEMGGGWGIYTLSVAFLLFALLFIGLIIRGRLAAKRLD